MRILRKGNSMAVNNRHGERGAALITSLIILTLLTMIGIAATNTSMLETMISATDRSHTEAFYAAEAGIEHLRRNFRTLFTGRADFDWDLVLNGSQEGVEAATATSYAGGAEWLSNEDLGSGYLYDVTVWNNADGGSATDDKDSVIFMRADARGANGATASVEISLFGGIGDGDPPGGYGAQGSGGAGKNSSGTDAHAITDFSVQMGN